MCTVVDTKSVDGYGEGGGSIGCGEVHRKLLHHRRTLELDKAVRQLVVLRAKNFRKSRLEIVSEYREGDRSLVF